VVSILPVVLVTLLESNDRHAREQIMLAPRHSIAVTGTFLEGPPAKTANYPPGSALLAGIGAEAGGGTTRPPLPAPAPSLPATPPPPPPALDPQSAELARMADAQSAARSMALGQLASTSYWQSSELRLAIIAYLALIGVAIAVAISILRSLSRFRNAAYEIVLGRVGDNEMMARNGVRELSGVALLLDRMVFDLRYMADQMRFTAAENAHSLRTPLATMRTALGAIRRSLPPDEPRAQRALRIIDLSLDRLSSVVNSVQRNDTTMADLVAAPRSPVDLTELAHQAIGDLEERARLHKIRLKPSLEDGVIVHAIPAALRLALGDVIASAVNASSRYGEVTVQLRRSGAMARLAVEDRGSGAEAPELFFQHDFQPVENQAAPPPANDIHSARLGLWNVKRTVEAFGGEVSARRNPHGGAAVSITLPCKHP
jgi:two-component system sensor histidine kinase ChvG